MKIEIWSDFVCPFCYIGHSHLQQALKQLDIDDLEIEYHSFQLEPGAQYQEDKTYYQVMAERKNMSLEDIHQMTSQVDQMAQAAGLNYNYQDMKLTDTYPAHRVFHYAKEVGKGNEYFLRLYQAFFEQGRLISDEDTLMELADQVGLDPQEVKRILDNEEAYDDLVRRDILMASQSGIQGVPFYVFNRKYALSGAQPVEVFVSALQQIRQEEGN